MEETRLRRTSQRKARIPHSVDTAILLRRQLNILSVSTIPSRRFFLLPRSQWPWETLRRGWWRPAVNRGVRLDSERAGCVELTAWRAGRTAEARALRSMARTRVLGEVVDGEEE